MNLEPDQRIDRRSDRRLLGRRATWRVRFIVIVICAILLSGVTYQF